MVLHARCCLLLCVHIVDGLVSSFVGWNRRVSQVKSGSSQLMWSSRRSCREKMHQCEAARIVYWDKSWLESRKFRNSFFFSFRVICAFLSSAKWETEEKIAYFILWKNLCSRLHAIALDWKSLNRRATQQSRHISSIRILCVHRYLPGTYRV